MPKSTLTLLELQSLEVNYKQNAKNFHPKLPVKEQMFNQTVQFEDKQKKI